MKRSLDPFEAAWLEQDESPPKSSIGGGEDDNTVLGALRSSERNGIYVDGFGKNRDENDSKEADELTKLPSIAADPAKISKMQEILSQFTEDQMRRYESFRRSTFQKANMKRLLMSITGSSKIDFAVTLCVCGIAKMFVGEIVETARIVMGERKESGPIRPCHIREAYRRLKLEGKVPKGSVPRLFR